MTSKPRLDVETLVARRMELGYSQRDVSKRVGVAPAAMSRLEDARSHARVTLDLLVRLADALELPAARLLGEEHREGDRTSTEPKAEGPELSSDAGLIGQLLLAAGKGVPYTALVRASGLNLMRAKAAVVELQEATDRADSLLRVTTNNRRVALLPRDDALSKETVMALERQVMAVDELKRRAARMLSAVVHGEITSDREQHIRHSEIPYIKSLLKSRLITREAGGRLSLSGEVAFSLGLMDARAAKLKRPPC